jgi:hypothetical protein
MATLDISQNVCIDEAHRLRPPAGLRPLAEGPGMGRGVEDVRSGPDEAFALPVGEQLRTVVRRRPYAAGEESKGIIPQRDAQLGSLGGEFCFQFRWQVEYQAHSFAPLLPLYQITQAAVPGHSYKNSCRRNKYVTTARHARIV